MFPTPREILKAREGSVAETPLALLLHAIFVEERTVVLELRKSQLDKRIAFEDGVPVGARSNLLHETLGRFLVDRGRLTEAQCHEALADAAREARPLGEVLVLKGHLSPYDLYRAMQQNVARKVLDAFTWTDARFRLHGEPASEETPLRINPAQLILTAATTVMPFEVVAGGLTFFDGKRFALVPEPPHRAEELKLGPRDAKLLQLLHARPTFEEMLAKGGLSSEEAMRRLYAFGVLGLVRFAEEVPETAPAPAPAVVVAGVKLSPAPAGSPLQAPETTTLPPPSGPEAQQRINDVMEAFLKHRAQDPFDLLGIKTTATLPEIRKACVSWAERYRPAAFTGELAGVADKAEELFLAGAKAYGVLAELESRNLAIERRARRAEEAKRRKGEAGADLRIRTDLLDAGEQFREGLQRLHDGLWSAAVTYFEFCVDCDPGRATYRAHLGWARFKDAPGRVDKAIAEIQQALRTDARCDPALFFEGQIREETGDLAGAEECYRRAIKAKPDERRYTDALKAVQLRAKKR